MSTFTAAEVRELADSLVALIDDPEHARQMLDAFAQRLEAEAEDRKAEGYVRRFIPPANQYFWVKRSSLSKSDPEYAPAETTAPLSPWDEREHGRREVYAEIAKIDEFDEHGLCPFDCPANIGRQTPHKPDCLWLRAQQVTP